MSEPTESVGGRRSHPRAALSLLIQYRFDTFDEFLIEYAENISEGGVFIRSAEAREMDSMVYLQFALRDGTILIEGLGRVVHGGSPAQPGLGIEFVNFDENSLELIRAIVNERLVRGT